MDLAKLIVRVGADIGDLQKKMTAAERAVDQLGSGMQAAGKRLTLGLTLPLAAVGGFAVKAAADFDSLTRAMVAVTGGADEAARQIERLREIAKLPAVDLEQAAASSIAFQAIGRDAAFAERMIRGVANAVALSGGSGEEFGGVMRQLRQVASLGKLMGEEMNTILENAPAMAKALQHAFGTTSADAIRKLNLSTEEFFERLMQGMESLPQVAGGAANSFQNLGQSLKQAGAAIGDQLLPAVLPLVDGLSTMLERVQKINPDTVRWGVALAGTAMAIGPVITVVGTLTKAFAALRIAGLSALAVLGPAGLVIAGLGVLSTWFIKNKLDALSAAGAVDEFRNSLNGLTREQLVGEAVKLDVQIGRLERMPQTEFIRGVIAEHVASAGKIGEALAALPPAIQTRVTTPLDGAAERAKELKGLLEQAAEGFLTRWQSLDITKAATDFAQAIRDGLRDPIQTRAERRAAGLEWSPTRLEGGGAILNEVRSASELLVDAAGRAADRLDPRGTMRFGARGETGGVEGWLRGVVDALKSDLEEVRTRFGAVAAAAVILTPILQGIREVAGPFLTEPLRQLGVLIGHIVTPALRLLMVPVVGLIKGISYLVEAFGWAVRAIGRLIDRLPFVSGGPIIRAGQEMMDGARNARRELDELGETARSVSGALTNIPELFDLARRRMQASRGMSAPVVPGGPANTTAPDRPGLTVNIINPPAGMDVAATARQVAAAIARDLGLGGDTDLSLAIERIALRAV